jgi:PA14 domain/Bacterial Ig domain
MRWIGLGLVVAAGVWSSLVMAGEVVTRDGKTHVGELKIEGEKVLVAGEKGAAEVPLARVARADFSSPPGAGVKPGHGLRGEYFAGRGLKKLLFVRNDPQVAYDWGETSPHPALTPFGREFSVRWTGRLRAERGDTYQIVTSTDDGARVWLDGKLIIDRWFDQTGADNSAEVKLEAGRAYDLRVEYYNGTGRAAATLAWSSANLARQAIPHENLLLPDGAGETAGAPPRLSVPTASTDAGPAFDRVLQSDRTGLRAEYFEDRDLQDLRFVRIDPAIDFNFHSENPPDPTAPAEGSVRWTGMIEARQSEEYRFHVEVHRRARLWVDGQLVIDQWKGEGGEYTSSKVALAAGKKVPFKLEYTSPDGFMICRVRWSSASTPRDVVPPEAFSLAADEKVARPVVALMSPEANALEAAPSSIKLVAAALSPNGKVIKVEFFDRTKLIGTATNSVSGTDNGSLYEVIWEKPAAGVYQLWVRLTDAAGVTALAEPQTLTVTGKGDGTLRAPWGDFFISNGEFKEPLDATAGVKGGDEGRTYTIDGALGTLVSEGEHDAGQFVVQSLVGDGQIVARLASMEPGDPNAGAMAGITLREGLRNRCKQFSLLYGTPVEDPVVSFVRRQEHWMNPATTERQIGGPYWLKLARHGNRVHAYTSADGKSWDLLGTEKYEAAPQAFVGLVAFSRDHNKPATAAFDHVEVTAGAPAMESSTKGFLTRGGTFVAAEVLEIDDNFVHYNRDNRSCSIPVKDVARVLFKPMLTEYAEKLAGGRTGALMTNGDFFEGEVKGLKDGHVSVSSVLFGPRRIWVHEELVAVVLKDPSPVAAAWEVATRDGSVYRAKSVKEEKGEVVVEDASVGTVRVGAGSVVGMKAIAPSPAGAK